jgi:hypothetical protein
MTPEEKSRLKVLYLGNKYCLKILKSHDMDKLLLELNYVSVFVPVRTYDKNDPHPILGEIVGIIPGESENISYNPYVQDRVGGYLVIQTFVNVDCLKFYYPNYDYLELPFTEVMSLSEKMGKGINITIKVTNRGANSPYNKGEVPIAPVTFERIREAVLKND